MEWEGAGVNRERGIFCEKVLMHNPYIVPFQNHPTHYFLLLRRFLTLPTFEPECEL